MTPPPPPPDHPSALPDDASLATRCVQSMKALNAACDGIVKGLRSGCSPPEFEAEQKLLLAIEAAQRVLQTSGIR